MADPSKAIFSWVNSGFDLHGLAGTSIQLSQLLRVALPGDPNPHLWSEFVPPATFPAGVNVVFTTLSTTFTTAVQGLTVDPLSGRVDSVANPAVRNVIVTATITGLQANTGRMSIRVFLHDSVTRVQLTPATLHIPANTDQSFSVLAVFSDGAEGAVVGDVTQYPPLTWAVTDGNSTDITVDANTGVVRSNANPQAVNQPATVQVTLPTSYGNPARSATASAIPVQTWDRDVQVKPVGEATLDNYQDAANVLFLPDGFTDGDGESKFNQAVDILAGQIRNSAVSYPFGLFVKAKSLNLYKAWIPSPEEGGTILNDLSLTSAPGTKTTPIPRDPTTLSSPGIGDLNDLVWAVGLPTKSRAAQTSFSAQTSEWTTLFGGPASTSDLQSLWKKWKKLYPRFVAVERDTVFGGAFGHRPQVTTLEEERDTGFNPRRTARSDIEPLLTRLYLDKEANLPVAQRIGRQFVSQAPDSRRVYILLNGPIDAGAATTFTQNGQPSSGIVMSSLINQGAQIDGSVPSDGEIVTPVIFPIVNNNLPADVRGTATHELGHTFNLGDEYAELRGTLPATPPLVRSWNIHTPTEVGDPIAAGQIRWGIGDADHFGWKRIKAAAVFSDLPTVMSSAPNFRVQIPVRPEQFLAVASLPPGTPLRLRRRPLIGTYAAGRFESNQITLDVVDLDNSLIEGVVQGADAQAVQDFVEDLIVNLVSPSTIIVMAPRLDTSGNELGIMHAQIGQVMEDSNSPLNRKQGSTCVPTTDNFVQSPVDFLPADFLPRGFITNIVGLYDGGERFSCGVYHPQAVCHMRAQFASFSEEDGVRTFAEDSGLFVVELKTPEMSGFCPVCRYILIDAIDPSVHGDSDDKYDAQYPELP